MKKTIKMMIGLLGLPIMLASCNGMGGNSGNIVFSKSDSTSSEFCQKMDASENDSTPIYVTTFSVANRSGKAVTVSKDDFTVTIDGKTTSSYGIVDGWKFTAGTDGKKVYITKRSDTTTIDAIDENATVITHPNVLVAFTVDFSSSTSYTFAYKGTTIKGLLE